MGTTPLNLWAFLDEGRKPRGQGVLGTPRRASRRSDRPRSSPTPENRALNYVALSQSRTAPGSKAYIERCRHAGETHKEAMRCLKRHLSNVVYRQIVADARRLEEAA